jgi:hypothetical protein
MDKNDPTMHTKLGGDLDHLRKVYHAPSYGKVDQTYSAHVDSGMVADNAETLPQWYPRGLTHMPVQYGGPSAEKENMDRLNQLIAQAPQGAGGAMRYAPIGDKEVNYLKYMEDMAELAKFDNYVESFVDPRQPGSAEFLFKVYPEYINRRMQQAHTDYEFALRNQMIDMWGINTFDDLYFKYLVDQGRISGPSLLRETAAVDDKYVASYLAPWRHRRPAIKSNTLNLPFASAKIGARPAGGNRDNWAISRANKPFSQDGTREQFARAVFENDAPAAPAAPVAPVAADGA